MIVNSAIQLRDFDQLVAHIRQRLARFVAALRGEQRVVKILPQHAVAREVNQHKCLVPGFVGQKLDAAHGVEVGCFGEEKQMLEKAMHRMLNARPIMIPCHRSFSDEMAEELIFPVRFSRSSSKQLDSSLTSHPRTDRECHR